MNPERILCRTQNTNEWFVARCGRVTGSAAWRAVKMLTRKSGEKVKGESSATRDNYKDEIISEILTGVTPNHCVTPYMDEGRENEPWARSWYEHESGMEVERTGFILHPTMDRYGSSPDGITPRGCIEIKCPAPKTHWKYRKGLVIPPEYYDQMQSEIVCAEADYCDFISFCPYYPPELRGYIKRVHRDEKRIAELEAGISVFLEEIAQEILRCGVAVPDAAETMRTAAEIPPQSFDPSNLNGPEWSFLDSNLAGVP